MALLPSEDWPPYRWLWQNVVLARDPLTGEPTPYTHGVRRNKRTWVPIFVALVGLCLAWNGRRWWKALAAFGLGFLAGHFFWCG